MQRGKDIAHQFPGLFLVHHNLPGSEAPSHEHPEHHLLIPLQGEISLQLPHKTLACGPGRMIYIAPNMPHVFRSAREKGERLICMIDAQVWRRVKGGVFEPCLLPANQLCKEILFYLLLNPKTKNTKALIDAFTQTLIEVLGAPSSEAVSRLDHVESQTGRSELQRAVYYARMHYADSLTVAELARRSGISERNLSRLCQIELGISPKQLLIGLRIEKAKELLLSGNMTVTETAFAVGYSALSQFIAAFRQMTGQLPSEFALSGRKTS